MDDGKDEGVKVDMMSVDEIKREDDGKEEDSR